MSNQPVGKCPRRIKRYGMPGALDTAPFGTECIIKKDKNFTIYIQMSANEEKPNWQLVGEFLHETAPSKIEEEIIKIKQLKM